MNLVLFILIIKGCIFLWLLFRFVIAIESIAKYTQLITKHIESITKHGKLSGCDVGNAGGAGDDVKLQNVANIPPEILVPNIGKPPRSRGGFGSKVD